MQERNAHVNHRCCAMCHDPCQRRALQRPRGRGIQVRLGSEGSLLVEGVAELNLEEQKAVG